MERTINIDPYSTASISITMMQDELEIMHGTAFLWLHEGKRHLVTNWHNLATVNPNDGSNLHPKACRANKIKARYLTGRSDLNAFNIMPIYSKNDKPLWRVHPTAAEQVDIAVLPWDEALFPKMAEPGPDILAPAINSLDESDIRVQVGSELFVVGYPRGLSMQSTPVWKKGTIATEPQLFSDEPGRRKIWIDAATREGMSGSPVIARAAGGTYMSTSGATVVTGGTPTRFVGIYSGRLGKQDALDAEIGIIWPKELVENVVSHGIIDDYDRNSLHVPSEEKSS